MALAATGGHWVPANGKHDQRNGNLQNRYLTWEPHEIHRDQAVVECFNHQALVWASLCHRNATACWPAKLPG